MPTTPRPAANWLLRRPARGLATLLAVAALATTAACGGGGQNPSTQETTPSADFSAHGPIGMAIGKDISGLRPKEVAEWNKAHPDEKVTLIELPDSADQQREQLIQYAQVKSEDITIMRLDAVWTAEFAAKQWVTEIPSGAIDMSGYLPQTMDTVKYFGKIYAVPDATGAGLLYYRKDLLNAAGITSPPTTWAEMKADCAKVKAEKGNSKLDCYAGQHDKYEGLTVNFSEAVNSAGGQVVDAQGKAVVNSPEAKKGLDFLANSFADGTIPPEAITWKEEQGRQAFQKGELIFLRNWAYVYSLAEKTDGSSKVAGKFDVAPLPGLNGLGVSTLGGNNLAISTSGKNKGTAIDFIAWLNRPEEQKVRMLTTSLPPPLESVYTDPDVVKANPYMPTLLEGIKKAQPRPVVVRYGDVTLAIQDAAYSAEKGEITPEQALSRLQSKLEPLLTN
jgi:trehalose/maltose transport system substrate-binding protein